MGVCSVKEKLDKIQRYVLDISVLIVIFTNNSIVKGAVALLLIILTIVFTVIKFKSVNNYKSKEKFHDIIRIIFFVSVFIIFVIRSEIL